MTRNQYIGVLVLIVVAAAIIYFFPRNEWSRGGNNNGSQTEVKDFLTCADAGYPVLESFPAQCRTPDGRVFVEELTEQPEVVIDTPARTAVVTSPMVVSGKAKGTWFFEANLPVTLKDENGKTLAQKGAMATEEWMTEDYVDFTVTLEFEQPTTEYGVLIIEKDNASGLPQNDASYAIPVRFR